MRAMVDGGLAGAWGISCWNPAPLLARAGSIDIPVDALMLRVGLGLPAGALHDADRLVRQLGLDRSQCWGMSPFGGSQARELIGIGGFTAFVRQPCTEAGAVLRLAFELPPVGTVCFGSSDVGHIHQAAQALALDVDLQRVQRYRDVLTARGR